VRSAFIETLCELAAKDERIWLLTGDLGFSVLERFSDRFPDRFVNAGVAEQNMTSVAAGLAQCGKIVFTYSIANFPTLRCLEQIRNDVCFHNANVKVTAVGGGLTYGTLGYTHHSVEDLAVLRSLPNMTVVAPGDPVESRLATRAIVAHSGPCYLRLGADPLGEKALQEPIVHKADPAFVLGRAIPVREGKQLTLMSTGGMLKTVVEAAEELAGDGIEAAVLSLHTVKPIDQDAILAAADKTRLIMTVEEHSLVGGLGSAVAEVLAKARLGRVAFCSLGLEEGSMRRGSQQYLREHAGLTPESIAASARTLLEAS
jgi:transketolase